MAKIGEGDPRWIVSERADGANVNSWHWQERDLQSVAHDAIKAAFKDKLLCSESDMTLAIKEVSEISGDVTVAQRKGKIMCYFELKLALKYSGTVGDSAVEGKITVPEVDHDTFREDYEITVAAADRTAANQKAEQWVQKGGRVAVRKVITDYFEALYAEYKVGTNVKTGTPVSLPSSKPAASPAAASSPAAAASPKPAATASALTSFTQVLEWRAPINDLWTILTDAGRATAYTRAPAQLNVQPGGDFSFLGGAMTGHYVTVEHPTKLAMQWRLSNWPSNVFSSVVLLLRKEEAGVTRLELAQSGVPEGEVERVRAGWQCNFWDPIKALFGLTYEQK